MTGDPVWNSLEIAKLLSGLVTPFVVAGFGYWITRRLKAQEERSESAREREREDRQRQHEERLSLERRELEDLERRHKPHIELRLDCQFLGERNGQYLTSVSVLAKNQGLILHKFDQIILRIRGIKDERFDHWEDHAPRACFPHKILETNLVPKTTNEPWNFVFIEPGVAQQISLTTLIPTEYTFILAHVQFDYNASWPHTAEAAFAVPKASN